MPTQQEPREAHDEISFGGGKNLLTQILVLYLKIFAKALIGAFVFQRHENQSKDESHR